MRWGGMGGVCVGGEVSAADNKHAFALSAH